MLHSWLSRRPQLFALLLVTAGPALCKGFWILLQGLPVDQSGAAAGLEGAGDDLRVELGRVVRTLGKVDLLRAGADAGDHTIASFCELPMPAAGVPVLGFGQCLAPPPAVT